MMSLMDFIVPFLVRKVELVSSPTTSGGESCCVPSEQGGGAFDVHFEIAANEELAPHFG